MKKNGFTLIELLAVIVLMGILVAFVSPNILKILREQKLNSFKIQINEVEKAADLYKNDCENSTETLLKELDIVCPTIEGIFDNSEDNKINISELQNYNYIETIKFDKQECSGYVKFMGGKSKVYLKCGKKYLTEGYEENDE